MKKKREPSRKPKYGMMSCIRYSMRRIWSISKVLAVTAVASIPVALALNAIAIFLPAVILGRLEAHGSFSTLALIILGLLAAQLLLSVFQNFIKTKQFDAEHFIVLRMLYDRHVRERDMDYALKLDEKNALIMERSEKAISSNHSAGVQFISDFAKILTDILCFLLFATVISTISVWMLLILVAGCLINYFMVKWQKKQGWRGQDERNAIDSKLNYLGWTLSGDLSYGKDVRLYHFGDFIDRLIETLNRGWCKEQEKLEKVSFLTSLVDFAVMLLRDGAAYCWLIVKAAAGQISAAEFVLYFSAVTQISNFLSGILNTWAKVFEGALEVSDYREFFDIKDRMNRGKGLPLDPHKPVRIEFRHVSFSYPNTDRKILDDVSFSIDAGEKIAVVGVNGAGKTTLTMLICGLLVPDEGEILINGHSIFAYNRDALYDLFALVPQDYALLPMTIAENIAVADLEGGDTLDLPRVESCVDRAGLRLKIDSLPNGVMTLLNRQVNQNATDLSGGETQKLLMARAMYRSAPVLILDEPTAALDPIAESELYQKYRDIAQDATSLFISHRLASTRFCDRIILLSGSRIVEAGTHEALLRQNGLYREMFDAQAQYYKEAVQ